MAKKKKTSKKAPATRSISYEKSLAELEQVVNELEQGKLSLDESLEKYEAGMRHLRACYAALKDAEKKVQVLVDLDEAGNASLANFEHDATYDEESELENDEEDFSDEDPNEGSLF